MPPVEAPTAAYRRSIAEVIEQPQLRIDDVGEGDPRESPGPRARRRRARGDAGPLDP